MRKYDYLIVGAGLFGAVFAYEMTKRGKKCFVIDKRKTIGGNIYTENVKGIPVHKYGAHIFHTSDSQIWEYVNQFAVFNHFVNSPIAVYRDELYNLPFNMNTFSKMWGIRTPSEAKAIIQEQRAAYQIDEPQNLEEQALSLAGRDVYEKLIRGYTEKQWGRDCKELPAFILKRVPLRFIYDNNYFTDRYQGIPEGGYTQIVEKLLAGIPVMLETSFQDFMPNHSQADGLTASSGDQFDRILYTGMIDEFFDYQLGELPYRSLRFEHELMEGTENYQGNAVVNYTEKEIPYTRIIEHKHFVFGTQPDTVVTKEYPASWQRGDEPFYPINDDFGNRLYAQYQALAQNVPNVLFGGRLGQYRYYDMDKVIRSALDMVASQQ
jgi:UDP-galactopyranose mutase